ncbi:MAG: hypothetical protein HQK49_10575 [Oligoflexia bacterium]|nr:hypothetical protein [Oligoflexia bacterium]
MLTKNKLNNDNYNDKKNKEDENLSGEDFFNQISSYGVILNRVKLCDIELIRRWRNDPDISKDLIYRKYISSEQQIKWFSTITNKNNFFYTINFLKRCLGIVYIKDIDYELSHGTFGLITISDCAPESLVVLRSTFCLLDFCFNQLILEKISMKILARNYKIKHICVRYKLQLVEICNQDEEMIETYTLYRNFYNNDQYCVDTRDLLRVQ